MCIFQLQCLQEKTESAVRPTSWRRGFTLIELLVVIAIIAILAAILFPVFAKAREKARQVACINNMKQISIGLLQYEQDYDECVPYLYYGFVGAGGAASGTSAAGDNYKWMDAIYPDVKSEAIFNCPDVSYPTTDTAGSKFYEYHYYKNYAGLNPAPSAEGATTGNFYYGSYGYNAMYRNDGGATNRTPPSGNYLPPGGAPQSTAAFVSPATTVWIIEGVNYYAGWASLTGTPQPANIIDPAANPPAFTTTGNNHELVIARHSDFADVLYCDGHVKSSTLGALTQNQRPDHTLISFIIQGQ